MNRVLPRLAALLPLLWWSSAGALGLGDIEVHSHLNQRFSASVPLTAVTSDEVSDVRVGLASTADFERAGIERAQFLSQLQFTVVDGERPFIQINSDQIVREPYLSVLLDVRSSGRRLLREYTVLLDPPERARLAAPIARPAPAPTPMPVPVPVAPVSEPVRAPVPTSAPAPAASATPAVAAAPSGPGRYGPVRAGETFWSIASQLRPDTDVSMDQMLLALYRGNPSAFGTGINNLLRGSTLVVPPRAEITAVDPEQARAEVAQLRAGTSARVAAPRQQPAVQSPREAAPPPAPLPEPAPVVAPEPAPVPAPAAEVIEAEEEETQPTVDASPAPTAAETPAETVAPAPAPAKPPATPRRATAPTPAPEPEPSLLEQWRLPLLALLLLAAAAYGLWRLLAARRAKAESTSPRRMSRTDHDLAPLVPPLAVATGARLSAREELERLQDSLEEGPVGDTQLLSTQSLDMASTQSVPPADATQIFEVPPAAEPPPVDFDLTGQFEAQTVQINLDANDPVSEADFHLAYGLYDEAALLLKQAAAQHPGRTDIPIKLAETYFAAGQADEFRKLAATLQGQVPASEWQKVLIMGQQLAPDDALFATGGASAPADMAVDMSFDEPPTSFAATPSPSGSPTTTEAALDFRLEDLELPALDQDERAPEPAPASTGNAVEFDLSGFDLDSTSPPAASASAPAADNLLDFDLESLVSSPAAPAAAPAPATGQGESLDMDAFNLDDFGDDSHAISGDEPGTKLDLARAYVDMGDNDMARTLLNEVLQQGNAGQQEEARTLIGRLG